MGRGRKGGGGEGIEREGLGDHESGWHCTTVLVMYTCTHMYLDLPTRNVLTHVKSCEALYG